MGIPHMRPNRRIFIGSLSEYHSCGKVASKQILNIAIGFFNLSSAASSPPFPAPESDSTSRTGCRYRRFRKSARWPWGRRTGAALGRDLPVPAAEPEAWSFSSGFCCSPSWKSITRRCILCSFSAELCRKRAARRRCGRDRNFLFSVIIIATYYKYNDHSPNIVLVGFHLRSNSVIKLDMHTATTKQITT